MPDTIDRGTVVDFVSKGEFIVWSQNDEEHPFYLSAYMTGGEMFNGEGDPEWVNSVPPAQFLTSQVFFTDPAYSETNLVVIRVPVDKPGAFADVTLDCLAEPLTGWQKLGRYEYTRVDLVHGNQSVSGCSNGRHVMESKQPFGVTVWGWGTAAQMTQLSSYAYPARTSVQPINDVVVSTDPQ